LPEWDICNFVPDTYLQSGEQVYGILAAPPCTMFSLARTKAKKPRDFFEGMEVVRACMETIWNVRCGQKLAFWAMENPMGYLRQFMGKPAFTFDPSEFGEDYNKTTDIWGYFKEPHKTATLYSLSFYG
jgi:site-specific DNA-cytosine methylase